MKKTRREMMEAIHNAWQSGNNDLMLDIWARSDGYGEPGFVPPQGYDWSGIRDSSDAAVASMYAVVVEDERIAAGDARDANYVWGD